MIEKFRLWLRGWLQIDHMAVMVSQRVDMEVARNEEVLRKGIQAAFDADGDLRTEFESRLSELEKSYAQVQYSDAKEVQPEPIMPGHIPFSARKRNWEQSRAQKAAEKKPKRST